MSASHEPRDPEANASVGPPARDALSRPLRSLRVSVTDRCNLRCSYCMPEHEYRWLDKADILRFEEIARLAEAFGRVSVRKVRLTGGEPLLRRDLDQLVGLLAALPAIEEVALTTNGMHLAEAAPRLIAAGLDRVTISLDTLDPVRFRQLTRRDGLGAALEGVAEAARLGLRGTKINTVVVRGFNDDELVPLLELGRRHGAEVRFIEYMDVGGATRWTPDEVVPRAEMLARIARHYGPVEPDDAPRDPAAPAERFRLPDGTRFGVIASTTAPFCGTCDRARLTADGMWYLCLYAALGIDLRGPLRAGESLDALAARLRAAWRGRTDRGAEARLAELERAPLVEARALRADPHLEMHTRGG